MALFELTNLRRLRKACLYLICIVVALWLQTMALPRLELFGAKPFFIPALVVAIGMCEGGVWGGLLGILAGIGCDWAFSDSTVLFLVLFAAFGFLSGMLSEYLINRSFFACMLLSVLALAVTALCQVIPLWIFRGAEPRGLLTVAGLQALWSLPFAALSYPVVKRIAGRDRDLLK